MLLPLVSGAISLYLLGVFALRACAGVIRGRAFLVDKNLPVSSGSFSLWPLLSELSWVSAMSLSGLELHPQPLLQDYPVPWWVAWPAL